MASLSHCLKSLLLSLRSAKRPRTCNYSSAPKLERGRSPTLLPDPRLDYRAISENVVYKSHNALNRRAPLPPGAVQSVARAYEEHKNISSTLNTKRNARSVLGKAIRRSAEDMDVNAKKAALEEAKKIKEEISVLEMALFDVEENLLPLALAIPNDTHPLSPLGPGSAAVTLSTHGPNPIPATTVRDHVTIGKKLGLLDLESGSTVTGSSWYYLVNESALLEIALTNYALSIAIKHGFTPVTTPDVVRSDIASRCGFQPRDNAEPPISQLYHINSSTSSLSSPELILSGTAEIPLAGMCANKTFPSTSLPLKVVGLGRAFRAEAGARGADTRGLYRVHQFTKLELFAVTTAAESEKMMEEMMEVQMAILEGLRFPFRVLDMPTEELGASAYRKYDMEAWMPGRGNWGEVSSLSNCTDYQARRLHIRYRPQGYKFHSNPSPTTQPAPPSPNPSAGLPFAHTLNGTAAAIPRLIIALLENGARFNEEGDLVGLNLPEVLQPFWLGHGSGRNIVQWGSDDDVLPIEVASILKGLSTVL